MFAIVSLERTSRNLPLVRANIRCHEPVAFELLPYMRFGMGKYDMLRRLYELDDFEPPSEESLQRLRAIIDEAFGREAQETPG